MDEVLAVDDVRRTYDDTVALAGVSLSVDAGEVFGLIGPNGAGKTTLVRALTGTTRVDSGSVQVLGQAPTDVDTARVGLLPQSFTPPERLTARELIDYYAGLYDDSRDPEAVLSDVGLVDDADTWYENLSGGQQRRTCVGTALVNDPDVLFLDEPTTGIDPAGRRSLWTLLERLANTGTTVFLTSHSMAEIERLADRVGLLSNGQLVAVGEPERLIDEHGGPARLVIETVAAPEAVADAGYDAERTEEGLVFPGIDPTEIGEVVAALEERGIEYESLTWAEPGLEEVYLELAGQTPTGEEGVAPPAGMGPESSEPVATEGGDEA